MGDWGLGIWDLGFGIWDLGRLRLRTNMKHHIHNFTRTLAAALLVGACALLTGCAEDLDTSYGQRRGLTGQSIHGTGVLADMFEQRGHDVFSWRFLSPTIRQNADCIVWFPDNHALPGDEVCLWLEDWLDERPGRTLIYVARDFDAEPGYWAKVEPGAPPEQVKLIRRRKKEAIADAATVRKNLSSEDECSWFAVDNTATPRKVSTLGGEWAKGVDPAKVEIELGGRIEPSGGRTPQENTLEVSMAEIFTQEVYPTEDYATEEYTTEDYATEDYTTEDYATEDYTTEVYTPETLLESDGEPLVSRIRFGEGAYSSRLIIVANGSFLLNLPLVNHEHRKLAGRLIDEVGPPVQSVVFLESRFIDPTILDEDPTAEMPNPMALLLKRPFCWIFLQLGVVGVALCFSRWPIFGIARQLPPAAKSDFGKHIGALAKLLQRSRDRAYATTRLLHYQQTTKEE